MKVRGTLKKTLLPLDSHNDTISYRDSVEAHFQYKINDSLTVFQNFKNIKKNQFSLLLKLTPDLALYGTRSYNLRTQNHKVHIGAIHDIEFGNLKVFFTLIFQADLLFSDYFSFVFGGSLSGKEFKYGRISSQFNIFGQGSFTYTRRPSYLFYGDFIGVSYMERNLIFKLAL